MGVTRSQSATARPATSCYLTSFAIIGTAGSFDYAERRLEATVSDIP